MVVGVISDTHGLLRPEAVQALAGVDHILHAGDVGDPGILNELQKIAPVTAIRGNVDSAITFPDLPPTEAIELGNRLFYLVHSLEDLAINAAKAGVVCVVSGHSHRASLIQREGVLYLNPGSAGPRRFSLPVTIGLVHLSDTEIVPEIRQLLP